ncbi:MAG: hypothetical protein HKP14_10785 [Bacteroidia bacterium]|nr:hypothetical protein [Bacteroidia bacterium]
MKYLIVLAVLVSACTTSSEQSFNKFSDEKLIHIYELQDNRDAKALIPFLKAKKEAHRVAAALAFASIQDSIAIPYLNQMLQIDQDELPRRAAALALGQIRHPKALGILRSAFDAEFSKLNQRYILEAIGKCGDSSTIQLFESTVYTDSLLSVGWTYGVFRLSQKGLNSEKLKARMLEFIGSEVNLQEKMLASHYLYRYYRVNPDLDKQEIKDLVNTKNASEVRERLNLILEDSEARKSEEFNRPWLTAYSASNDYEKALKIEHLDENFGNPSTFLYTISLRDTTPHIIRNAAYSKYLKLYPNKKWNMVLKGLQSGDMALQSLACYEIHALGQPKYGTEFNKVRNDLLSELQKIKTSLTLPGEAETFIDVCKAIDKLGGDKFEGYQPEFNHPIDWDFVKMIPDNQIVTISTSKGDIELRCFVNDAPGTVANFLHLVDSGYYDNKFFHRVVPQFVIQGGCPRGDGWGGLNWTQRSEFSNYQTYETGTVGIASSGLDTEGVQFFITHCPTPHLDGRYTIFARVIEGMDVVNKIEVGDKILSIRRSDSRSN